MTKEQYSSALSHFDQNVVHLSAGPLSLLFDNGMIRSIFCGKDEVVRRIYMALRDQNWNTIPYTIENLTISREPHAFVISFSSRYQYENIHFLVHGSMTGSSHGVITATLRGEALSTFESNRIGWCLLYPLQTCKGIPCNVVETNGKSYSTMFPSPIEPHQPVIGMRSLSFQLVDGTTITTLCSGDTFEMEDQRNWTDASYKVYSTPLTNPIPVTIATGTTIEQTITISVAAKLPSKPVKPPEPGVRISCRNTNMFLLPKLGLVCPGKQHLTDFAAQSLAALNLDHLRFDIDLSEEAIPQAASRIHAICSRIGCGAEIALHLTDSYVNELTALKETFKAKPSLIHRFLIFHKNNSVTPPEIIAAAARLLKPWFKSSMIVAGTNRYFVEINRNRIDAAAVDGICYTVNPQVHTFDALAIMENLEGIRETVASARLLAPNRAITISPLTLRPQKNPDKPQKFGGSDPRQVELFTASWTLGTLWHSIQANVGTLTYFATTGPEGLLDQSTEELFPVFHLFSALANRKRATSISFCSSSDAHRVLGCMIHTPNQVEMLLANITPTTVTLTLEDIPGHGTIAFLDTITFAHTQNSLDFWQKVAQQPLTNTHTLLPYAVALVRF